jgi:hypothetical protein
MVESEIKLADKSRACSFVVVFKLGEDLEPVILCAESRQRSHSCPFVVSENTRGADALFELEVE